MKKDLEGFRLGLDGAAVADHFGAVGFDPEAAMTPDMYEKPKAAVCRPSKQRTTKKRTPPTAVESKEWMQRMEKGIAAARARGIGPPPSPAAATPERITIKSALTQERRRWFACAPPVSGYRRCGACPRSTKASRSGHIAGRHGIAGTGHFGTLATRGRQPRPCPRYR